MKKRLEEAQRQQRLEQENRRLRDENYYLQSELQEERSFTERLTDGIGLTWCRAAHKIECFRVDRTGFWLSNSAPTAFVLNHKTLKEGMCTTS